VLSSADGGDGGVGRGGGPLKLCFSKKNGSETIPGVLLRLGHHCSSTRFDCSSVVSSTALRRGPDLTTPLQSQSQWLTEAHFHKFINRLFKDSASV